MALNFRAIWKWLVPAWLNKEEGELVGYTMMTLNDASLERLRLGHLARFPQQGPDGTPGPDDALAALGRDRGVTRGIDESSASYAYRLTQWLVDARTRGATFTLLKTIASYVDWDGSKGCSFRVVDNRGNWFSRAADGTETYSLNTGNWNWDGDTERWSRFWVIIYPGTRWVDSGQTWNDAGDWGDGTATWGASTITEEQTRMLRAIISDQKPAGTRCHTIILAFDPASFDPTAPEPDGTWAHWANRLSTALYL